MYCSTSLPSNQVVRQRFLELVRAVKRGIMNFYFKKNIRNNNLVSQRGHFGITNTYQDIPVIPKQTRINHVSQTTQQEPFG
nr:MAG TPA: hypothetical protein [Caudoviricetes sp.]